MKDDAEKAAEIEKKRRLAAKGLAERKDGKPIDPMADDALDPADEHDKPLTAEEKKAESVRVAAIGFGVKP
jgi:hypothetical protein